MIEPLLADDALIADIRTAQLENQALHLWWLGQSGFLVQWQGRHLLFDPYLSDSLTRKYAETKTPHVRISRQVVRPERLDFVDVITSSHNHTDHLDAETLNPLLSVNPQAQLIVPAANLAFAAQRLGVPVQRLSPIDDGQCVRHEPFELHAVPAAHEIVERDEQGRCRYLGYVLRCGPFTVYHSGDTVRYEAMVECLAPYGPIDVALLPINGAHPDRCVAGNLSGREAAQLAADLQASVVIPCHYDMFAFNTASPAEFQAAATRLGQPHRVLQLGERFTL